MTMNSRILLVGNSPLFAEWKAWLEGSTYQLVTWDEIEEAAGNKITMVVEVANLDLEEKKRSIQKIDQLLSPSIPILSTSLAVTATEIASWTKHPERVCGFGTFAPLSERNLIEVAPALQTKDEVVQLVQEVIQSLGKQAEVVVDEVGLVFPRILSLIINEAAFALMEGTATAEDIDIAMKKGTNYPFGPLEWADRIGLDDCFAVISGLHRNLGEERFRPAPYLRKLVLAGWVGVRSGRGFYSYDRNEG
jgi:3-hydroxybutyryl-CoA dehydrogenase